MSLDPPSAQDRARVDDRARVEDALRTAAQWSPTLRGRIEPGCADPTDTHSRHDRVGAQALADAGSGMAALVIRQHAASRGMPTGRHAASLAFQRYCHRVCGIAVIGFLRHEGVLDLRASNTATRFEGGSPAELLLAEPELIDAGPSPVERLVSVVVDEHLLLVARAFAAAGGVGLPNLWGNMAASFAGAARVAAPHVGIERARSVGEEIAATRPHLSRGGSYRVLHRGDISGLFFDRASCCHWYAAPDGRMCSWCSRVGAEERTARFHSMLAERAAEAQAAEPRTST